MDERECLDLEADDEARVARAADELCIEVARGFKYLGIGPDGKPHAICEGDAADLRVTVAILRRLEGEPIEDCLADSEDEARTPPEWTPPVNPNDAQAWIAYAEEQVAIQNGRRPTMVPETGPSAWQARSWAPAVSRASPGRPCPRTT